MIGLRVIAVGWLMHVKMLSRSSFNGVLGVVWPMFFATSAFLMFGKGGSRQLISVAVGASLLGIWSSTSTSGASLMQDQRSYGTLELLAAAPAPFAATLAPITLALSTIGTYSMIATLAWGRLFFGISLNVAQPGYFLLGILVTVLSIGMFGFMLSVSVVRFRTAWAIGNMLEYPVWLICGFLIAPSALPGWVQPFSWVLAPTWAVRAVREATFGGSPLPSLGLALALAAAYGACGILLSHQLLRSARKHAKLALS
jgi:ABC-2 type transport system permease protein